MTPPNPICFERPPEASLVSVVIPAFAAERYLRTTVESVLAQTFQNFEITIVDDGAKDGTGAVADELTREDPRIQVIHQSNAGVCMARNNGIGRSRGEYIALLDADDLWHPDNLSLKVAYLKNHPAVGFVHSAVSLMNEEAKELGIIWGGHGGWVLDDLLYREGRTVQGPCSNIIVRRTVFERVGGFEPRLSTSADQEFCMRVAQQYPVGYVDRALFYYRILASSMSSNVRVMENDEKLLYELADTYGMFRNRQFRARCRSHIYGKIAGSWWVNANNKARGLYWLWRSLKEHPGEFLKRQVLDRLRHTRRESSAKLRPETASGR
jgi:glycosyltransferase involved in cell wall biosynthesis